MHSQRASRSSASLHSASTVTPRCMVRPWQAVDVRTSAWEMAKPARVTAQESRERLALKQTPKA
eukprot:8608063-Pyramimonas_sp.AAC.1